MEQRDKQEIVKEDNVIRIEFEPEKRAVAYDEDKEIGECEFTVNEGVWTITHTGVDSSYGGRGIAEKLLDRVVDEAKAAGVRINPVCSYAAKKFSENKEYRKIQA
ncbi:MAG: GNAT family N-acetyltransferase [Catonella sp.]|nr:GNAT family N-acetyltransferase [Catonella sp.]MDY6357142.1 GNAT family N-acetyltransferase [Catonella sp.]